MRAQWIFALLLLIPCLCPAQEKKDFRYLSELGVCSEAGTIYRVPLSFDIISRAAPDFSDLLLLDEGGREIPFVVLADRIKGHSGRCCNLSIVSTRRGIGSVEIEFVSLDSDCNPEYLMLSAQEQSFVCSASVYGFNESSWVPAGSGIVYRMQGRNRVMENLKIPCNGRKYEKYRLMIKTKHRDIPAVYEDEEVFMPDVPEFPEFRISSAFSDYREERKVNVSEVQLEYEDTKTGTGDTELLVKAGIPLSRLCFEINTPFFRRGVDILGKIGNGSFSCVLNSEIHGFVEDGEKAGKTCIDCRDIHYSQYRIVIRNDGNPPLDIRGIKASYPGMNLFFAAPDNSRFTLYVGSDSMESKNYDLADFITASNWHLKETRMIEPGPVVENAAYKKDEIKVKTDSTARSSEVKSQKKPLEIKDLIPDESRGNEILIVLVIVLCVVIGVWLFKLTEKSMDR